MKKTVLTLVAVSFLIACGGAPGEPGPVGPTGPKGDTGPAGTNASAGLNQTTKYVCTDSSGDRHEIYKFPDGSVMTHCEGNWSTSGPMSSFSLYRASQNGAATALCLVQSSGASYMKFEWNGSNSSTQTVYATTTSTYSLPCTQY